MNASKSKDIDEYISAYPEDVQEILQKLRSEIKKSAPNSKETISYGMPAFKKGKVLVYFAAFKNHIGFYPTSSPIVAFEKELVRFKHSKGSIQFPLDKPIPYALVKKIVKIRVKEDIKNK
jgi:uncharacterized protein YdhG (YjbR/CyaY superfamily)